MYIQNNYHNNVNSGYRCNILNFKGEVSPKFYNYVNTLRNDCFEYLCKKNGITLEPYNLNPVSVPGMVLVNNICERLLNNAERIMKKCFHSESVLSVDTTNNKSNDIFILSDERIKEFLPDYLGINVAYVPKKELVSPLQRLIVLNNWTRGGDMFIDAYCKQVMTVICYAEYKLSKESGDCNKENLKKMLWLLDFWNQHVELLNQEEMYNFSTVTHLKPISELTISKIKQHLGKTESID